MAALTFGFSFVDWLRGAPLSAREVAGLEHGSLGSAPLVFFRDPADQRLHVGEYCRPAQGLLPAQMTLLAATASGMGELCFECQPSPEMETAWAAASLLAYTVSLGDALDADLSFPVPRGYLLRSARQLRSRLASSAHLDRVLVAQGERFLSSADSLIADFPAPSPSPAGLVAVVAVWDTWFLLCPGDADSAAVLDSFVGRFAPLLPAEGSPLVASLAPVGQVALVAEAVAALRLPPVQLVADSSTLPREALEALAILVTDDPAALQDGGRLEVLRSVAPLLGPALGTVR